ncbi:DUF3048 domain-containing protein [Pengzhenrongella sicca]|uniref:DUF3048 domain-containing protein n=1 Tax=Pengzhenrongella sicca TaxID=2819238 RepID=A0A8A4ZCK3_9MICO|nr:DUF3048 domain-containing protein [Pengzhenrongella sicca]QTE29141.1 DUF3048 domain-containing protein [Pengzhenrongella sicca]
MPITLARSTPRRRLARIAAAALSGVSLLALAGCGAGSPEPSEPSTEAADIAADKGAVPAPVIPPTWPLTGVAAADIPSRPALAVKIENDPSVRPQTGLDQADMVWEELVEGGVTRFVAVFHSVVPESVGPIRSVRPMDGGITAPLHGLIAFSGGQAGFVNEVADAGVQIISMDKGAAGFARKKGHSAPHNVFGTPTTFWGQADAEHSAAPAPQFTIARTAAAASATTAGTPIANLALVFSPAFHPNWTWSAADGAFTRSEGATPSTNPAGAPLTATNVVALRVRTKDTGTVDPAGTAVLESVMVDSGDATVVTGGMQIAAKWSKASIAEPIVLTNAADGSVIRLAPGNTWVELVPPAGSITAS